MKGYEFDPVAKTMTFWRGEGQPTLVLPDSIPVILLPERFGLTNQDAVFPDVPKGRVFGHDWNMSIGGGSFSCSETGRCMVSALPQEWSQTTVLGDAPAGTDVFAMQVKLNRTVAPTHSWISGDIPAMVPQGVWISLTGSMMLEMALGFGRAMSIYIDDAPASPTYRKLVLHQQQSVSVGPGGFGEYGMGEPASYTNSGPFSINGGETLYSGGAGYPVYYGGDSAPQYKTRLVPKSEANPVTSLYFIPQKYRQSGTEPPSSSDPTNYGATWRYSIRGQFGRKS